MDEGTPPCRMISRAKSMCLHVVRMMYLLLSENQALPATNNLEQPSIGDLQDLIVPFCLHSFSIAFNTVGICYEPSVDLGAIIWAHRFSQAS